MSSAKGGLYPVMVVTSWLNPETRRADIHSSPPDWMIPLRIRPFRTSGPVCPSEWETSNRRRLRYAIPSRGEPIR